MPQINLLSPVAPGKSLDENSANLINMYLMQDQSMGKYSVVAYPTPGLTTWTTVNSPIRCVYEEHGVLYVVGGNTFYSIASNGTATTLGTLSTSTGFAKITGINQELLIIDGTNGYCWNIANSTFTSPILSTTYVSSIVMTAPGSGYTLPTVSIYDSYGSGATGYVLTEKGTIIQLTLVSGGTGYASPTITINGGGTGATAYATVQGGVIQTLVLSARGENYVNPTVTITDATGTGASATATATNIVSNTPLTNLTLSTGGANYVSPVVTILDPTGTGATATATQSAGVIQSLTLTAAGTGYTNPIIVIYDSTAPGTMATGTASITGGQITSIAITDQGLNYNVPIVAIMDPSGVGATATVYTSTTTFKSTVLDATCQDEFGLVIYPNSQEWASSAISDLLTWPSLSVAESTGNQTNLVAIVSLHREIWLLGTKSSEIWYNAGNTYFTWARRTDVFIEWGCAAARSVAKGDNTIFFLAQSITGGIQVVQMQSGYIPMPVSTDAINYQISTYSTVSDAIGFCYQQEGHEFYVITFPTANATWVYDITLETWHQRQSLINGTQQHWLPNCFAYCYGLPLVGDPNSGNIYKLDMTNYTDNGNAITRTLITHPFYTDGTYSYCDRLQIDFDQTPGSALSAVNLYVSRDGGNTFGAAKPAYPVQTADGQWRVYWPRLGRARTWVLKIQTTMNNKFIILGAWVNMRDGST